VCEQVAEENIWTKEGIRLHNEELHNLYASPNTVTVIKLSIGWAGHVACIVNMKNIHKSLVGKPEGNRSLRRSRRKREDNIKVDLREIGWDGVDWIYLPQDRHQWRPLENRVMKLRVP
jgi:hypothetical protein